MTRPTFARGDRLQLLHAYGNYSAHDNVYLRQGAIVTIVGCWMELNGEGMYACMDAAGHIRRLTIGDGKGNVTAYYAEPTTPAQRDANRMIIEKYVNQCNYDMQKAHDHRQYAIELLHDMNMV